MKWLSPLPLWTGILAGPIAWALDLTVSYALVQPACASQRELILHLVTPGALALVAGGAAISLVAWQRTDGARSTDGGRPHERARFMAALGLSSNALFALTIAAGAIPRWVLNACQ